MPSVIDEDGRLFGSWNVIDVLVVVIITAMVIAGYAAVTHTPAAPTTDTVVTYRVDEPAVIANQIAIGFETADATITAVADVERYEHPDTGEVYKITDVTVLHSGARDLAVGDEASVRFDEVVIDGRVISVEFEHGEALHI